jgi:hypothetical protein
MKIEKPQEGRIGDVADWAQTLEEQALLEEAKIDAWLAEGAEMPPVELANEWSTVQEVARRHRCSDKTIRKRIHEGSLKAIAHPDNAPARQQRYRVHRTAEEAWIAAKQQRTRVVGAKAKQTQARRTFKSRISK